MSKDEILINLEGRVFLIPGNYIDFHNSIPVHFKEGNRLYPFIVSDYNERLKNIRGYVYYFHRAPFVAIASIPLTELLTYEVKPITTNFRWRKA